jgi:hypothetical protein
MIGEKLLVQAMFLSPARRLARDAIVACSRRRLVA